MAPRDSDTDGIVIVGGGLAAQRCAEALRRLGYNGRLRMVCAEPRRPYDRPPLSKEVLAGTRDPEALAFKPSGWYETQAIDLLLGAPATHLDLERRKVSLSNGSSLSYRHLVIATGSRPRPLRILDGYENVCSLRSLEDCIELREVLAHRPRIAIVGAGFIGQEVAATARRLGAQVTMIEAGPSPLASVLGLEIGSWFVRLHESEGVEVLTGCTVTEPIANGTVCGLRLSRGKTVEADHVVVGVGVEPDVGWLMRSGLATPAGVRTDLRGRTAAPGVFAIGDAAATYDPATMSHVPGAHWEAAARQGARCARAILGLDPAPAPLTSFWTDQYGIRIQYLGRAHLADAFEIEGDPAGRCFAVTFRRGDQPVAALLVDRARDLPAFRNLIENGAV